MSTSWCGDESAHSRAGAEGAGVAGAGAGEGAGAAAAGAGEDAVEVTLKLAKAGTLSASSTTTRIGSPTCNARQERGGGEGGRGMTTQHEGFDTEGDDQGSRSGGCGSYFDTRICVGWCEGRGAGGGCT